MHEDVEAIVVYASKSSTQGRERLQTREEDEITRSLSQLLLMMIIRLPLLVNQTWRRIYPSSSISSRRLVVTVAVAVTAVELRVATSSYSSNGHFAAFQEIDCADLC